MRLVAYLPLLLAGCSASASDVPSAAAVGGIAGSSSGSSGSTSAAGTASATPAGQAGAKGVPDAGQGGDQQEAGHGGTGPPADSSGAGGLSEAGGMGEAGKAAAGTSSGSGGKAPTFCEPGEVGTCVCADGALGVNQCNVNGTAFGPCVCQPKPPVCSKIASGCPDKRDFYDCPTGATLPVTGCLQYQNIAAFYCCGSPEPAICDPKQTSGKTIASAKVTSSPAAPWTLPASQVTWLASGEAVSHPKPYAGVGVTSSPMEFGAVEVCVGFVCSNGTLGAKDCVTGDKVAREGVEMCCVTGDSSAGGKLPQATLTCDFGSTVVRITNKTETCRDLRVTIVN